MTNKVETNDILVNDEDSSITPVAKCDLVPISHKDFNEFIKGKGFTRRNKYRLKELKATFGFNHISTGGGGVFSTSCPVNGSELHNGTS